MLPVKCESTPCKLGFVNYRKTFYVTSLDAPCPSCGLSGHLVPCVDIHLMVEDRFGTMLSKVDGKRYNFACGSARSNFLRLSPKNPQFPHHYTTLVSACTCTACLKEYGAVEVGGEMYFVKG